MVAAEALAPRKGVVESVVDRVVVPVLGRDVGAEVLPLEGFGIVGVHRVLEVLRIVVDLHVAQVGVVLDAPRQVVADVDAPQNAVKLTFGVALVQLHERILGVVAPGSREPRREPLAVGQLRAEDRQGAVDDVDRRRYAVDRVGVVAQVAQQADAHLQALGHLRVDLHVPREAFRVVVGDHDAALVHVTAAQRVGDLVRAARNAGVVLLEKTVLVAEVVPVGGGIDVLVVLHALLVFEDVVAVVGHRQLAFVQFGLVAHVHILNRVGHHVGHVGRRLNAEVGAQLHHRCALLGLLRGDEDDAVGGLGTVDRGRSVLQHRDRLDVAGIQLVERILHAVDQHHGAGTAHRADAAYADRRAVAAGLRRSLVDVDAGHRIERLRGVRHGLVLDLRHLAHGDRAGQVDLLLHAVSDHHHVVEELVILLQHHGQMRPVAHFDLRRVVTDERHAEPRARSHVQGEFALRIGHHAVRRALDQHVRPHDRIAGLGLDAALQLVFPAPACRVGFVKHDVAAFEFGQNSLVGEHAVEQFQDVLIVRLDRNALPEVDLALPIPERVAALRLDRFDHLAHGGVLQRQRNHGILRVKSLGRHREPTQGQQSAQSAQHPLAEKVPEGPSAGRIVTHKD